MTEKQSDATGQRTPVRNLEEQAEIERSLKQITVPEEPEARTFATRHSRATLWFYACLILGLGAGYLSLEWQLVPMGKLAPPFLQRLLLGAMLVAMLLAGEKLLRIYIISRFEDEASRYNLRRLIHFFVLLALAVIVLSTFLINWTTAVVSIGVLSIILGLALQAPLGNLFAWFYILTEAPYRIGDRIKIGESTGDVIDVGYFVTTLWEFGGEYLSSDHPSGRTIKFPNSLVLTAPVFNYSWSLFPYIWNEIKFYVAYESDLPFVAETMKEVARAKIGEQMRQQVATYRQLLARTPVDELDVNDEPVVLFRAHENTWIEAIVRYLVHPKQAGTVKTELIREMLERLSQQPDRVLFPSRNAR